MKCISGSLSIICDSSGNLSVICFKVILAEKALRSGDFFRENPFCSVYRQAGVWKKTITSRNNRLYRI